ncbi:Phr family secreted Rap phosphatase inhibitor [Paenibacillus sp. 102]|uniref:Phr family secreted Rap phosphatase inhibitor n=1 Tax=Paenibacillus sp. 102 TaxID=3120823 RepID=UPI0031BB134B
MKKIGLTITGLALAGIMTFSVNNIPGFSALNKGDTPAPQRPDLALNIGDTPVPADNRGDADGDGGGAPAENLGDTWSSSYAHGNTGIVSNEADGNTGSPADNRGDGGISKLEEHGETI